MRALARGATAEARATFAPVMLNAMTEDALGTAWREMQGKAGAFQSILSAREDPPRDGFRTIVVTTRHAKGPMDVRVVYDKDEKVSGLWFSPGKAEWSAPPYAKPSTFSEQEVSVGPLPGTLTLPKAPGPARAVVLVHGSGPNDRDESVGAARPFKDLAWGLASRGIAALRYEKRSKFAPGTLSGAFDQDDEVTFDTKAAVALLAGRAEIDPKHIVLVGHSQGGSMAPRIARAEPRLAGIVVLAGSTRPFDRLLVDQWRYLLGLQNMDEGARATKLEGLRDELRRARSEGDDAELVEVGGSKAPRRYWRDLLRHEGQTIAKDLSIPILVAQGGRDYQVTLEDFGGWKLALGARSGVTFRLYPSLNHLFVKGEGTSTPDEYRWPGHVDPAVIEDLSRWIAELP